MEENPIQYHNLWFFFLFNKDIKKRIEKQKRSDTSCNIMQHSSKNNAKPLKKKWHMTLKFLTAQACRISSSAKQSSYKFIIKIYR